MQIIKLNAINSTNLFLKDLIRQGTIKNNTVVTARYQTDGKGQVGGKWVSKPGENLMFSIFKTISNLKIHEQFYLSMAVALTVRHALEKDNIPDVVIKWPNDILSANKKIGGILIENSIKTSKIASSVIGIGININQSDFSGLPQASSLKNITGIPYDIDQILYRILDTFPIYMNLLEDNAFTALKTKYESCLFRIHQVSRFNDKDGNPFTGCIKGVNHEGKLMVTLEDDRLKSFALKEVKLLY